jgi:hypothetical protein
VRVAAAKGEVGLAVEITTRGPECCHWKSSDSKALSNMESSSEISTIAVVGVLLYPIE